MARLPNDRQGTGRRAEDLAVETLERSGFTIVTRNWRRPEGELDLVAMDGPVCVFVEVRSRTGLQTGHPLETITPRKRLHVIRSARLFMDQERPNASDFRFDVVGVTFGTDGETPDVVHIRDAFQVDG